MFKHTMNERFSILPLRTLIAILILVITSSCNYKEPELKTEWLAGMCCPNDYGVSDAEVEFFNDARTNLNFNTALLSSGWCSKGQFRRFEDMHIPDSVAISYNGLNNKLETYRYEGIVKLPKEKIISIFKYGYKMRDMYILPQYITCGLAPGGRVCVWVDNIEMCRTKIKEIRKISNAPILIRNDLKNLEYITKHPVDYSIWDKADSRFDLDFGFCSENMNVSFFVMYCISKEGIRDVITENEIDTTQRNIPFGKMPKNYIYSGHRQLNETRRDHKMCLPVDIQLSWINKEKIHYDTHLVMPNNLPQQYTKAYLNPETGKTTNFNRIVFGVEKDGEHCVVWLDGPGKQEKIMRFKGQLALKNDKGEYLNEASYTKEITYY